MSTKTYQEQLEDVQAAIEKIESDGQAYSMDRGGFAVSNTRGQLATLYKREAYLRAMVAREQRGTGIGVRFSTPT